VQLIRPLLFVLVGAGLAVGAAFVLRSQGVLTFGTSPDAIAESAGTPDPADPPPGAAAGASEDRSTASGPGSATDDPAATRPVAGVPTSAEAEVRPLRSSDLAFAGTGILAERLVEEGDEVAAGDPLLRLDDERERARLSEAEAALAAAEARLQAARAGERAAERQIAVADAAVRMAEAQRDGAEAALRLTATQAQATIAQAEAQVRQAVAGIGQAEANLEAARAALAQAGANASLAVAQRDQAVAARDTASLSVRERTLRAPFDGRVVSIGVEVGETLGGAGSSEPGASEPGGSGSAVRLADLSGWRARTTNLTELQVVAVQPGDEVTVEVDALPGVAIAGVVERIGYLAEPVRGEVTYAATVRLNDASLTDPERDALRPGMTAVVRGLVR